LSTSTVGHRCVDPDDGGTVSQNDDLRPLSPEELAAETGAALPDKEVISLLDLNADLDLALDAAAPIDLAVAANANVAAPIDASVGANVLSVGSTAQALSDQGVIIDQGITGDAVAHAPQESAIDQSGDVAGDTGDAAATTGTDAAGTDVGAVPADAAGALDGNLLNVDVDLAADLNLAAPIDGAVAANANVAAPIDASVAANVGSIDSTATAISQQDAIITQDVNADAEATADQQSTITQ
jgi:hypothetical protein